MNSWTKPQRRAAWFLCAALLVAGCGGSNDSPTAPTAGNGVPATLVASASAVAGGPPGAYYVTEDRRQFHLRCPCGLCTKSSVLALTANGSSDVWTLSGELGRPTLSPSIHWFETDGRTTHWHGWLREGTFVGQ
jgi:hypothetical protein